MEPVPQEQPRRKHRTRYPVGIRVRCTPEERAAIGRNARQAGRSVSRFLVELGTLQPGRTLAPRPSGEELAALEALMFQLRKVGIQLNQLLHGAHHGELDGNAAPPGETELAEVIRIIGDVVRQIRERIA